MSWASLWLCIISGLTLYSCVDEDNERENAGSQSQDAEYVAEEPVIVTGSYLRCQFIDEDANSDFVAVGCNPYDRQSDELIDLNIVAENIVWTYDSELQVTLTTNYFDSNNIRWQAKFDFARDNDKDINSSVLDTLITLSFNNRGSTEVVRISDYIKNLLMQLVSHQYVKLVFQSIHMNPPEINDRSPDTVAYEFKINGQWEKAIIQLSSINFQEKTMRSDRFGFRFNGSDADWKMLLRTGLGLERSGAINLPESALIWSSHDGEKWTFDASSSMQSDEPFDLKPDLAPVELIIDLGGKHSFHGFRLDGGQENPGRLLPNGFADRFYFQVSDDLSSWKTVSGSEVSITDRSLLSWEWDAAN
ncbi:MAG: hypothetical protein ACOH5I_01250 [Oligoflexus sp.]